MRSIRDVTAGPHRARQPRPSLAQPPSPVARLYIVGAVADGALPPCVVLDTNQWRSQYGLRSKLGASLLFLVRQHEGRLGVPEVIESEIVQHLVDEGKCAVLEVASQFRVLQAITGSHPSALCRPMRT
jgi:hypothetical protein